METKAQYKTEIEGEGVNLSHLARLMLLWEQKKRETDELERGIKDAVLQLGKTQTVGYVRATYSNPRKSYDYEGALEQDLEDGDLLDEWKDQIRAAISEHMKTVVDWRAACKTAKIEPIVTEGGGPGSVSLKLLK